MGYIQHDVRTSNGMSIYVTSTNNTTQISIYALPMHATFSVNNDEARKLAESITNAVEAMQRMASEQKEAA